MYPFLVRVVSHSRLLEVGSKYKNSILPCRGPHETPKPPGWYSEHGGFEPTGSILRVHGAVWGGAAEGSECTTSEVLVNERDLLSAKEWT